jgi:hypothetical protein
VEKHNRAGEAIADIMVHVHCTLDIQGYKCTYVLTAFRLQQWLPQCYILCTLCVLFKHDVDIFNVLILRVIKGSTGHLGKG